MTRDHRYPTEIKTEAINRATVARFPQLQPLFYGRGPVTVKPACCLVEKLATDLCDHFRPQGPLDERMPADAAPVR